MSADKIKIDHNKRYLENHNITKYFEEMMSMIVKEKPEEPVIFMIKFLQNKAFQLGLQLPSPSGFEINDAQNEGLRKSSNRRQSSASKSYDKPWLNGTNKKGSFSKNSEICSNNTNQKTENSSSNQDYNDSSKEPFSLNDEFKLVTEPDLKDDTTNVPELSQTLSKGIRHSSKTKENLLELVNEERQKEIETRISLENQVNLNEKNNTVVDCAIELAEDPDLYSNEFNVNSSNNEALKPKDRVLIVKQNPQNNDFTETAMKFGICTNCSKFYQSSQIIDTEPNHSAAEQNWNVSKGSLILDDLESASQVNGPRRIDNESDIKGNLKTSKKQISVSDFEVSSKAWPVVDATSEMSFNQMGSSRSKVSGRNLPN